MIQKLEGKEGRQMKFLDNDKNLSFKHKVANLIFYKIYMEQS
jgi:hypothetical protein